MEIERYAPIIIPTLNRYEHFRRCIESLVKCTHADKTELIIGLDYPPTEKYYEGWLKIRKYLPLIKGFSKVTVIERNVNFGAIANVRDLIAIASKSNDAFIYTEDDNEFSPCFLDFINKGLIAYKDDPRVLFISGYNYPIDMSELKDPYYFSHELSAWGVGRWVDKYEETKKVVQKPGFLIDFIANTPIKAFLSNRTRLCSAVNHIGYDVRGDAYMTYYQYSEDKYTIFPTKTLVRNYGHDGSGIHCGKITGNDVYQMQSLDNESLFEYGFDIPVHQEKLVEKKLLEYHTNFSLKTRIKRVVLVLLIKMFAIVRG